MPIKHAFTSGKADLGDATLVRPSDWNADHTGYSDLWASGVPVLFVDPTNGSDTNSGRSPGLAKATVAAAYTALPSTGGLIVLLPGRHNLATGLVLTKGKRLALKGLGHWQRTASAFGNDQWDTGGGVVLYTAEATPPTSLVTWAAANDNEEGFSVENLIFECKTGVTKAIQGEGVNHGVVDNCAFMMKDTSAVAIYLHHDSSTEDIVGDDASWWRITRNMIGGGGRFFESVNLDSKNHNGIVIADNVAFFSSTGSHILLGGGHRCSIRDNNLEGSPSVAMIRLLGCHGCTVTGNGGESTQTGNIFIQVDASHGNFFSNPGTSTPTASDKLYDFINGSQDNLAMVHTISDQSSMYDVDSVSDTSTGKRNYYINAATANAFRGVWLPQLKRYGGSPEGAVVGYVGDLYLRTDGGAGTVLYVKESGVGTSTGWVPIKSYVQHSLESTTDHSLSGATAGEFMRATGATTFAFEAIPFSITATLKSPVADDVFVWRAPYACTLTNLRAYQDTGTGTVVNAFKGSLASPTLFRASNYTITAADTVEDAGSLQNTAIAVGDKVYFRIASVAGSPNEVGIQLDLTRP